nr:unnamed protein product [Callosobruchus analis]
MYGLIIENMVEYIKQTYGEDKWDEIRRAAAVDQPSFSTHQVYPESLLPRLSKKAVQTDVIAIYAGDKNVALSDMQFEQVVQEVFERQNGRKNVIVFGLKELVEAALDKAEVTKVLTHLLQSVTFTSVFRIGKFDRDLRSSRPVKITLADSSQVSALIKKSASLKNSEEFTRIATSTDKTPRQMEVYGRVKEELDERILRVNEKDFFEQMGVFFISFISQYGYDRVLSVLGRHMRDFLNGLDNLHEYLKFSYPRMRAPSFICENETKQGLTLHYRSKRRGFVARHFYHKEMKIELVREELLFDMVHVTFQLTFDNRAFTLASLAMTREEKRLPISASVLFEIFPFCIVFGSDMLVRSIGNSLMVILPDLVGKKITNWFDLVRPLISFKFGSILNRTNNIFELVTVEPILNDHAPSECRRHDMVLSDEMELSEDRNLRLKGQMIYMDNWKMMMYLGTPVMPDLNSLINSGLYINDLSMHDFSRDLMLAGTQQSVELKLALDQEQQKSKKLEESMRKLDEEMRRTDELLYQMIPKQVADRLRKGENPIDTCEMFDTVSILFSDVVTFTEICSRIAPMEVVSMLNGMYSIFDKLTERNRVYKVETIGDAYMVVSGAPEKEGNHAERVCDMALDMVEAITDLKDPSTGTMKTYWLQSKESRPPVLRSNDTKPVLAEIEYAVLNKENALESGRSVTYSPITFKDVARRSIASSPVKANAKELRSNSAGAVYTMADPADLFGSLIMDQDDLNSPPQSAAFRDRSTTVPTRAICSHISPDSEITLTIQRPSSATPASCTMVNIASQTEEEELQPKPVQPPQPAKQLQPNQPAQPSAPDPVPPTKQQKQQVAQVQCRRRGVTVTSAARTRWTTPTPIISRTVAASST